MPARIRPEKRWPGAAALVVAIALELLLPRRFSLGPDWTVPTFELVLIVAILIADRGRGDSRSPAGRVLSLVLVIVLVAEAAGITVRLVVDLIEGGPETNSATELLLSFRTSRASFLPPPFGVVSGSDRERFEFAHEVV